MGKITRTKIVVELLLETAIKANDTNKVINLLYENYFETAVGISRRLGVEEKSKDKKGKDIVQDAMEKMWQVLKKQDGFVRFEGALKSAPELLKYFYTIVHNESLNTLRKRGTELLEQVEHLPSIKEDSISDKIDQEILKRLLRKKLGDHKYKILELYNQGYSLQDIADEMGMQLSNVKYHKLDAERKAERILLNTRQ
jgi:RNA polymerase sigma factor (sigma-70 family)